MDPISIAFGLAKFVPMIAGMIGGDDAEETAQKVVDVAESVTGRKGQDAVKAIEADPAMLEKFNEQVVKELEVHAKDRQSARRMQTSLAKSKHASAYAPAVISLIVTAGFFGMLYVVFNKSVPEGSEQIANSLLGVLGAGFTQVLNFWLGSSKSSQDKTMIMGAK